MKKITLKEMLEELVKCILENKERPTFYWKCEYYSDKPEFLEITQIDLLDSRFKTFNDDFSESTTTLRDKKDVEIAKMTKEVDPTDPTGNSFITNIVYKQV